MGTWMIHFLFPELKSQHLGRPRRQLPPPPPIPTLSLPTEGPIAGLLSRQRVGTKDGGCWVWPGLRPPSDTAFEAASCDPEGVPGSKLDRKLKLGPLRARVQEAPSQASQRKRVPGYFRPV